MLRTKRRLLIPKTKRFLLQITISFTSRSISHYGLTEQSLLINLKNYHYKSRLGSIPHHS